MTWLDVAFSLDNPFNYNGFVERCQNNNIPHALSWYDYGQRVGWVSVVMVRDGVGHQEAYQAVLDEMSAPAAVPEATDSATRQVNTKSGCGGCGGGRLR